VLDEWPDEPEEDDPEARWGNPEEDLVNVPEAPKPSIDESEIDPELSSFWWRTVVLANIALGGVTIGPMVVFFEGMWLVGTVVFVVGVLAFVRVYQHVKWFENRNEDEETEDGRNA
jgi:hypothetical protein